jgi:hypothetical protein
MKCKVWMGKKEERDEEKKVEETGEKCKYKGRER